MLGTSNFFLSSLYLKLEGREKPSLTSASANYSNLVYDYSFNSIDGGEIRFDEYKDKVIVVVNVASRCGYTPQYEALQQLWSNYKDNNLVIIGVPTNNFRQEPGSNNEIKDFCETNFGINFPMTEKADVIGKDAHPFFKWSKKELGFIGGVPRWNFHKIIIGKDGNAIAGYTALTRPSSKKFISEIEKALQL